MDNYSREPSKVSSNGGRCDCRPRLNREPASEALLTSTACPPAGLPHQPPLTTQRSPTPHHNTAEHHFHPNPAPLSKQLKTERRKKKSRGGDCQSTPGFLTHRPFVKKIFFFGNRHVHCQLLRSEHRIQPPPLPPPTGGEELAVTPRGPSWQSREA